MRGERPKNAFEIINQRDAIIAIEKWHPFVATGILLVVVNLAKSCKIAGATSMDNVDNADRRLCITGTRGDGS